MTDQELAEMEAFYWPRVVRRAMVDGDEWEQGFAKSIARKLKRASWRPSPKEAPIMRRMVRDLRTPTHEEIDLIER